MTLFLCPRAEKTCAPYRDKFLILSLLAACGGASSWWLHEGLRGRKTAWTRAQGGVGAGAGNWAAVS
jgi:hypothetical protein